MMEFISNGWHGVMSSNFNPLRHIPDENVRHLILQILSWMWCTSFSLYFGSWFLFGLTIATHFILLLAIFITVITFDVIKTTYK